MGVGTALSELVAALTEHARVMAGHDVPPEQAVRVIERVRTAAERYADETFEASGWGSPFAEPWDGDEDGEHSEDDADDESGRGEESGGGTVFGQAERFSVTGRWDFAVSDPAAWYSHVSRRLAELGAPDCAVELNSGAQAMHELLSHDPPFDALTAHGLRDGGEDWMIENVPEVLSEMPDDKRYG